MSIDVRTTTGDEARPAMNILSDALLFPRPTDEEWEARGLLSFNQTDSLSAWDGDQIVGHAGAYRLDTTVPGGARVKTAGVTRVGVLPTHTRRGLLNSMIRRLLTDVREAGAVLASLRASEAVIYQRYGFSIAAEAVGVTMTARSAGPVHSPADGSIRVLPSDELLAVLPDLYDRCARRRAGSVARPDFMWIRILRDAIGVKKPSFVAVHVDPSGNLDGYVHYDVRWADQPDGSETGEGEIHDLFGVDAAVERALWAYLLDIDLVLKWKADNRPVDEPIRFAVRDTRAYKLVERWDEQWLRILDVDAALAARTYRPSNHSVALRVTDPLFSGNCGTWRIGANGAMATADEPDLTVAIDTLSAAYLGGTSWSELAGSGHVGVVRDDAVDDADTLFATRPAPFCGTFF